MTEFRAGSLDGRADGPSRVDYALARKATLRAFQAGRLSRFEICDAHPDLLRAARFCGEKTTDPCPICERGSVVLVSYVFSEEFSKREDGRVWERDNLAPLLKLREARLYTVEVCADCSWNHLRSQLAFGGGSRDSGSGSAPGGRSRRRRQARGTQGRATT